MSCDQGRSLGSVQVQSVSDEFHEDYGFSGSSETSSSERAVPKHLTMGHALTGSTNAVVCRFRTWLDHTQPCRKNTLLNARRLIAGNPSIESKRHGSRFVDGTVEPASEATQLGLLVFPLPNAVKAAQPPLCPLKDHTVDYLSTPFASRRLAVSASTHRARPGSRRGMR